MGLSIKARHLPGRIAAGAFILNSGIGKLSADAETAERVHGFAAGTYPFLKKIKPKDFVRLYAKTPGMRKDGTPFPTQQGTPIAKDVWMLGIGLGLVLDDLTDH